MSTEFGWYHVWHDNATSPPLDHRGQSERLGADSRTAMIMRGLVIRLKPYHSVDECFLVAEEASIDDRTRADERVRVDESYWGI